ncbi:alpha-galactosidase [Proteiniphilum sp. X52]|uniref:alpha-galactosidase n=1 Tax=Proteiniphilum sp. X52 TaxID=2382159 RepID=UPI000F09FA3B|nr:alpha-galactosidase [Proteiniphilum sp. X52]RNC65641.1 alpha-galactosidase [Proteiniphilum sp. X52]
MFLRKVNIGLILALSLSNCLFADNKAGYARKEGGVLYIGNNKIERSFQWNNGNLITLKITDKENGKEWENLAKHADFFVPGQSDKNMKPGTWDIQRVETPLTDPYSEVIIEYAMEKLSVRRVFRIYDDCPAIAIDTYLRGRANNPWIVQNKDLGVWKYLPQRNILSQQDEIPVLDQVSLPGKHWKLNLIEFSDNSDSHNTFVKHHSQTAYADNVYKGNILFWGNMEDDLGLFYLKESPLAPSQLAYPGADFIIKYGEVKSIGIGIVASDLQDREWTKTYSIVFGVSAIDESSQLKALHSYHKHKRNQEASREEMITMNTWGDRGPLERLTEDFCFRQIDACAALGISHFQLDWGWQETSDYMDEKGVPVKKWTPKRDLFPNGFEKVVAKGKDAGVEVCLYFVPNSKYDNEEWEKDADAIIYLYKKYGVRIFKIDGQQMQSKAAEVRTRRMYEKVMEETDYNVIFNYDITAGQRGGYFYLNNYGNMFIENRYTDFMSYYPYKTLRNIWMLSKYVPAEKIQVEFLNKWRNEEKYANDLFAPASYSMDYLFATTMAGQPLVFMDVADLPENAFESPDIIRQYKKIQHEFHKGMILPIGAEPSGKSWTGFQSTGDHQGFFLIFREFNKQETAEIETWLEKDSEVELTPVLGYGKKNRQTVKNHGNISVQLPKENSFVLYKYKIISGGM